MPTNWPLVQFYLMGHFLGAAFYLRPRWGRGGGAGRSPRNQTANNNYQLAP
jgi:hypothetical protein